MADPGAIVCFGEVLLRLSAPAGEMLLQTPAFEVAVGGAEANVAVALARAGAPAAMVTVLPNNPLGSAARDALRRYGVDTRSIRFTAGRMGLYFLTPGAVVRASDAFYDRANSAFAMAPQDLIDWDDELKAASRLHLSGVTPALNSTTAAAALRAAQSATRLGVPMSFDANYRAKLWASSDAHAPTVLRGLLSEAETAFIDYRDVALVLDKAMAVEHEDRDALMAEEAFRAFPRLQRIAFTRRNVHAPDRQELIAHLIPRTGPRLCSVSQPLYGIVDRVGAGDAFAAGILYGLVRGLDDRAVLDLGLASACLKHSVVGDAGLATADDLNTFLEGGLDIRR